MQVWKLTALTKGWRNANSDIIRPQKTTPKFLLAHCYYTSFTAMHLEHSQDTIILHCSPDLEACLHRRTNDEKVYLSITADLWTRMTGSAHSPPDKAPTMMNHKAALCASQDPLFETERDDKHGDVPKSACESGWTTRAILGPVKWQLLQKDEVPVECISRHINNRGRIE